MRRRLPPLRAVQYFEAAAERENFAAAAEALGVSKGAVSQQVKLLEQSLGAPLFVRSGRGLRLTDAGRRYLGAVRSALSTLEQATTRLSGPQGRNLLRLSVLPVFASLWLVPRLSDFQDRHPQIDVEVSADAAMIDFERDDAHIGIRYGTGDARNLTVIPLGRDRLYPVCSPAYRKAQGLAAPADLERCRLLHDTYLTSHWPRWAASFRLSLPNLSSGQYFTHTSMALDAAKSGAGVVIGHDMLVQADLASGALVRPFEHSIEAEEQYYIVHPRRAQHLGAVKMFEAWLVEKLRE
jgi:LysR family glycine cleavage system transcriptional activator